MASIYSTYKLFTVVTPLMKMAPLCDIMDSMNSVMTMTTISLRTGKARVILCHREMYLFINYNNVQFISRAMNI